MARAIRLYGKADSFDIEFSRKGDKWETNVPPDLTDGVYACQLTAIDELGDYAYWVGELYMCQGVCCFKLLGNTYKVNVVINPYETKFKSDNYHISYRTGVITNYRKREYDIEVVKNKYKESKYVVNIVPNLSSSDSKTLHTVIIMPARSRTLKVSELCTEWATNIDMVIGKECYCEQ